MLFKQRAGFTFVEVIVTVAIISLLTTLAFVSYANVRVKARDAARVSSINQLMTALQLYKYDTKSYPTVVVGGQPLRAGQTTYISAIPTNPEPRTDGGCADKDFHYATTSSGYMITLCLGENTGSLKKGINICTNGQCQGIADYKAYDADGNSYGAAVVGTQIWLAQNLSSKTKPDGTCINGENPPCADATVDDGNVRPRLCFNNDEANCQQNGALYTWDAVMNGSTAEGVQGICPAGWHVPSDSDWHTLEAYLATPGQSCDANREDGQCEEAGAKLGNGGSAGMNIVLAGYHHATHFYNGNNVTDAAYVWSSTQQDADNAWIRGLSGQQTPGTTVYPAVSRATLEKVDNVSLRCIMD